MHCCIRASGPLTPGRFYFWNPMTPDKRATLLKAFALVLCSALLVGSYITQDVWLAFLLGAK